jgi:PTS system ascorbate-specific IIB component
MKILAVCGLGQGTSLILRITIESVLKELGVDADVEHIDVSSARGMRPDLIVTSRELADTLEEDGGAPSKVVIVNNFFDKDEVKQVLLPELNLKG